MTHLIRNFRWVGVCCAAALVMVSAQGASERFELRGIFDFGGEQSFSLRDLETGAIRWGGIGRSIGGYRIEEYDAETQTLSLVSDEERILLTLKKSDGIPLEVLGSADEEWVFSQKDVDPDTPGEQSYQSTRAKIRFEVGSRNSVAKNDTATRGSSAGSGGRTNSPKTTTQSPDQSPSQANGETAQSPNPDPPGTPSLSNSDRIAVEVFEKNYIATREAPEGVDVFYSVGPR